MSLILPDSPKPFQTNSSYYPDDPDPGTKHDTHDNGLCSLLSPLFLRLKIQPPPAYYLF